MGNENKELVVKEENNQIMDFSSIGKNSNTKVETFSNIKDSKKLFNLGRHVDSMLNDCVGETIKVKEVLIKRYQKPLDNPIIDEVTGEIVKDYETSVSCILIDQTGKSYATGSKTFTYDLMRYLGENNGEASLEEGIDIKIIKINIGDKGNKALTFELV